MITDIRLNKIWESWKAHDIERQLSTASHLEIKSSSGISSHSRLQKMGAAYSPQDWSTLDRFLRILDTNKQVQRNFSELFSIKILIRFPRLYHFLNINANKNDSKLIFMSFDSLLVRATKWTMNDSESKLDEVKCIRIEFAAFSRESDSFSDNCRMHLAEHSTSLCLLWW
jgi:uncharacterized protein with ParB-like and HNH nuclease domain